MPDLFCIHDYILHVGPTQWIRIINKSLEVYENEVEIDTFEQNLRKMDIFCDKCFKNNPVSQNSSPSLFVIILLYLVSKGAIMRLRNCMFTNIERYILQKAIFVE